MTGTPHYRGRRTSWVCVLVGLLAFSAGAVGLILANWWVVGAGVLGCVVAGILALAFDITSDVQLDPLHQENAEPFVSLLHRSTVDEGTGELTGAGRTLGEGPELTSPEAYAAPRDGGLNDDD